MNMIPVFLKMIEKSLVLYLEGSRLIYHYGKIQSDTNYIDKFNVQLKTFCTVFAQYVKLRAKGKNITKIFTCNEALGNFIVVLLSVYWRKIVKKCMDMYLFTLSTSDDTRKKAMNNDKERGKYSKMEEALTVDKYATLVQLLKTDFLKCVGSFVYFYECNAPRITQVQNVSDYYTMVFSRHFLAAYNCRECFCFK
ncbi:hypothetical protein EIN_421830 [Entamoeba invadens IP1]|uniref:Uncharacterized protein n=1 Tax=Entamoeba invadens IP1 TaxID=370355 RepID=A0A0A1U9W0_ENTIV|nr:hypothetical protein EIN_421830 [Entamoeba invadens IP1]ELP91824.1 hypothetical protein EIN_421830 [Entamoeba invadens IP1]|eukprot:XP_004258595.1 hypothetical protein EIN_421830 [Entamoeba invadens IP1]